MDRPVSGTVRDNLENLEIMLDLPEQTATAAFDQALPDSDAASTWSFCAIIRGEIWDPSLLTTLLNEMESTPAPTLANSAILSYACRNKSAEAPAGHVEVEGYLKLKSCRQYKRGTLRRRFMHPDLSITWTPCHIGRYHSYTNHDFISRFHRETALPPAGILQRSADAVGPRLRVDYLGPSDAPLNKGGWAARKERLPAADSDASGAGAPAGAPPAALAPSPAAAAGAGAAAPADALPANAPAAATSRLDAPKAQVEIAPSSLPFV